MCFVYLFKVKSKKSSFKKNEKKKMVHFAFDEPVVSHPFCHNIIEIVSTRWEERKMFFAAMK